MEVALQRRRPANKTTTMCVAAAAGVWAAQSPIDSFAGGFQARATGFGTTAGAHIAPAALFGSTHRAGWHKPQRTWVGRVPRHVDVMEGALAAGALYIFSGIFKGWWAAQEARARRQAEKDALAARASRAYVCPRTTPWTDSELAKYDGSRDPDGPILIAVDGIVFNVWKGRHFYAPGCEYHIFAGRDATRLLARRLLEEEHPAEACLPLSVAEQATLQGWIWSFKGKYEEVGVYAQNEARAPEDARTALEAS